MIFKTYFLELQFRFFILFSHFFIQSFFFYTYKIEVFKFVIKNLKPFIEDFTSLHLTEIFYVYIKFSLFLGFYFTVPLILLQLHLFLSPALYKYENKIVRTYCFLSILLFFVGTFITFHYVIPFCWQYFISFNDEQLIKFEPRLNSFINLYMYLLTSSQIFLQVLVLSFFFLSNQIPSFYKSSRKIVHFFFLLLSTLITPPDFFSQIFLTLFLIFIYECFVFLFLLKKNYKTKRVNNGN